MSFAIKLTSKPLVMLVQLRGLRSDSTCVLEAVPPVILFISFTHWFTHQNGDIFLVIIDFHVNSTSSTSFKGYNVMFTNLIKIHAVR